MTVASHPANLRIVLLDNGLYEITGGQLTAGSGKIDFAGLAALRWDQTSPSFHRTNGLEGERIGSLGRWWAGVCLAEGDWRVWQEDAGPAQANGRANCQTTGRVADKRLALRIVASGSRNRGRRKAGPNPYRLAARTWANPVR